MGQWLSQSYIEIRVKPFIQYFIDDNEKLFKVVLQGLPCDVVSLSFISVYLVIMLSDS